MRIIDRDEVKRQLKYDACIAEMRRAMMAFSNGETKQVLRSIIPLGDGNLFGIMPGGLASGTVFGAKLVSVFHDSVQRGGRSHQGVVVLFDSNNGAPICIVDAGEITAVRTACASAAATDALARKDAAVLSIIGTGEQAVTHARAMCLVRDLKAIMIWGRRAEQASVLAANLQQELSIPVRSLVTASDAVSEADIVCTVTSAKEPVLLGRWLKKGTHVNLVGSSFVGPVEVDDDLVARSRFIADSREGVRAQGAEFLKAIESGVIKEDHLAGEIGEVFAGKLDGRQSRDQITVYKSLGHIVQDLATARLLYET